MEEHGRERERASERESERAREKERERRRPQKTYASNPAFTSEEATESSCKIQASTAERDSMSIAMSPIGASKPSTDAMLPITNLVAFHNLLQKRLNEVQTRRRSFLLLWDVGERSEIRCNAKGRVHTRGREKEREREKEKERKRLHFWGGEEVPHTCYWCNQKLFTSG